MKFVNPGYFFILLVIPIYLFFEYARRRKKEAIQVSIFSLLVKADKKWKNKFFIWAKNILISLIIIFFTISLARPQGAHEKQTITKNGIDIILALDVSQSMMAQDLKPNRIEAAKQSLEKFINNAKNDRIGVVVFAGTAFTQSPLTFDYNILKTYVNQISVNTINQNINGLNGTAIGDAILAAVNRLKKSNKRSKVLVILTDGDANTGVDPILAAKKATQEGIKIYTVGIGKPGGAPLPITDQFGRKVYAKNSNGSLFKATFNESNLKKIASIGGGMYFRASDNQSFNKALKQINSLEKSKIKINTTTEYSENFQIPLIILFVFFIGFLLLIGLNYVLI